MTTHAAATPEPGRDWWVLVGMTIAAASAAVASFSGLRGLAEAAGWPDRLAWLLPLTIDAYAMTSARVWLAGSTPTPAARRFARANALGAITASTAGNAAYHAIGAGLLSAGWPIVVTVGAVPATVLGLTAHLHALRGRAASPSVDLSTAESRPQSSAESGIESGTGDRPQSGTDARTESRTGGRTGDGPKSRRPDRPEAGPGDRPRRRPRPASRSGSARRRRPRTETDLWTAARDADARHRAEHGRPITRDALRTALRVSGPRATELRRQLAAADPPDAARPSDPATADPPAAPGGNTPDVPDRKEAVTP
jgi:hypothetical protein